MLPGIRQRCCWSKLQRVSPCWTASNPPHPTLMHVVRAGTGAPLTDSQLHSMILLKGEPFTDFACGEHHLLLQPSQRFLGRNQHGHVWQTAEGRGCPPMAGKATALPCSFPQFPISECAGRQTAVTYQHDIVQLRFSCLPQSNENFCSMPLFLFYLFPRTALTKHQSMHTHMQRRQWKRVILSALYP